MLGREEEKKINLFSEFRDIDSSSRIKKRKEERGRKKKGRGKIEEKEK